MSQDVLTSPADDTQSQPSSTDHGTRIATETGVIYAGTREPMTHLGQECSVTVDDEPLEFRYDLLWAFPTGQAASV